MVWWCVCYLCLFVWSVYLSVCVFVCVFVGSAYRYTSGYALARSFECSWVGSFCSFAGVFVGYSVVWCICMGVCVPPPPSSVTPRSRNRPKAVFVLFFVSFLSLSLSFSLFLSIFLSLTRSDSYEGHHRHHHHQHLNQKPKTKNQKPLKLPIRRHK